MPALEQHEFDDLYPLFEQEMLKLSIMGVPLIEGLIHVNVTKDPRISYCPGF
jgi:hypothetical protein